MTGRLVSAVNERDTSMLRRSLVRDARLISEESHRVLRGRLSIIRHFETVFRELRSHEPAPMAAARGVMPSGDGSPYPCAIIHDGPPPVCVIRVDLDGDRRIEAMTLVTDPDRLARAERLEAPARPVAEGLPGQA
jgi:hypothetical protein